MVKIGDRVRFLNSVGGGIVRSFQNKDIVLVEEEDGFETPVLARECVVVESVNENNFPSKKETTVLAPTPIIIRETQSIEDTYDYGDETPEREQITLLLAFVPMEIKQLQTTNYDAYLINDSNYFLHYTLSASVEMGQKLHAHGELEPNTKLHLTELSKDSLNDWEHLRIQCLPFKTKNYNPKPAIDTEIHINPVKFYKLHSFSHSPYFKQNEAMIVSILEKDTPLHSFAISETIAKDLFQPKPQQQNKIKRECIQHKKNDIVEVDLHINALLDTTTGMNNHAMLQYQLDKFHEVLKENSKNKGQKIVFIHGKGEGKLRTEILKELKNKYPTYYAQDASFREYGFGATMVTVK